MTKKQERPTSTATVKGKPARRASVLGPAGIVALVVMALALALGGLFWFQKQRSSSTSPEALIAQAAEAYAQSGDVAQARELLSDLEADRLAQLFARMEADAPDELTRQSLDALRQALQIPLATPSLWDSLLNQNLLLITLTLAALPLLGALVVGLLPVRQSPAAPAVVVETVEVNAPVEAIVAKEQPGDAPKATMAAAQPAPQAQEAQPALLVSQTPPPTDASQPAADPKMQDILSSVFESETSSIKYEVLLNALEDIQASDLLATGRRVAQQLSSDE